MGRNVFVQGASRGLGLALTRQLLSRNDVEVVYASARDLEGSALGPLRERHRGRLRPLVLDVGSEASIAAAAERVASDGRALHLLVNVAGVLHDGEMQPEKRLEQLARTSMDQAFVVNAYGPILTARHLLPHLAQGERAVIANISAHAGSITDNRLGGWYSYRASKAAQNMFTRTLAVELGRRAPNVICVALDPGTMDTDLSRPFRRNVAPEDVVSPDRAASRLLALCDALVHDDTGQFLTWDHRQLPW
jgi:NAD(P)-dependent dehydrogenase (short-subunit alcohol dehydrogenase family)